MFVKQITVAALLALLCTMALGQAISGDLVGVVKDSSGALVASASVEATNLATGQKETTTTNTSGEYRFTNLPAGHYSVEASSAGMKGGYGDVEVQLNHAATANITAVIAGAATTVEVSELAATIDTTTPQIENTFTAKQLQDLPITSTGSGVLNLSLLNAGVASSGGIGAGTGPSISGQRPRNNNFTVEGVDNNSKTVTGPLMSLPNDSVDNFTVLQNQFSPEFGHSSGGQFNETIKSGSNQFHGRAWEYFQNRDLNAIDSQTAQSQVSQGLTPFNPRFDDNRFGGQFGGPIIKEKLFFFTSWQYEPEGLVGSPSTACAPTSAGYTALGTMFPNSNNLNVLQKYLPAAGTVGGSVCPGSVSVNGSNIPTGPVGFLGPSYTNTLTNVNSLDWNISSGDQLRVRYAFANQNAIDVNAQLSTFWQTAPTKFNLFTLGEYHTFSSTVNNEFRLGFNRFNTTTGVGPQTFPGLNVFPNLVIQELNGIQLGPDPNAPQETIQNTYQAVDNVGWIKGRHSFKFGAEYREYISPQTFTQRVRGDYEWNTLQGYLNDAVPDFLAERSMGNVTYYGNQQAMYLYGNDVFKVTPSLTLNLGLRYELTTVPLSQSQLQPLNAISNVPGLITFGSPQKQTTNFLPRVGFAYSPGGSGNTSIRGGFGMAVDVLYDNLGILSLPPQVQQTCDAPGNMTAQCFWNPGGFMAGGGLPSNPPAPFTNPADARAATSAFIPNQSLPYSETWNLGVQHIFAQKYTLEVRYVGTRGIHLPVQARLNRQTQTSLAEYLPTYTKAPSQAQIDALPFTLAQIAGNPSYVPAYAAAGFNGSDIVGFENYGASNYNGLQTQFSRNFTNGLQFQASWTWSHAFDNSTADVFSTYLTPRRAQDFQNFRGDWSTSALDRRHRVTLELLYDLPFFKNSNWMMKNVVGNWQFAPIYTFESPEYATVQSGLDTNGNGDTAGDRAIFNPSGIPGTGSDVTPLCSSGYATSAAAAAGAPCGGSVTLPNGNVLDTIQYVKAYAANNPNAQYILAGYGALANASRNTLPLPHLNNFDMSLVKRVNITERQSIEFQAQAVNVFNHPQYVPGFISDIQAANTAITTAGPTHTFLVPGSTSFNQPNLVFSNHPRAMVLVLKYIF